MVFLGRGFVNFFNIREDDWLLLFDCINNTGHNHTEPGYVPNYVLTLRYQSFMSDWFGTNFKMWREEKKEAEGLSA